MDFALIERLMRMLESSSLSELDVSEAGLRVRLAKQTSDATTNMVSPAETLEQAANDVAPSTDQTLCAGIAGTFYRSPAPGADPFVTIGQNVREGDQLAIIEAMKMLNPVEADRDGTIVAIRVEDGGSVEPGTQLFDIEPD
ncbi:acetyl-CoA carboxylase, biotin carboxyl carrier protein [Rhizobium sp. KVB221]|uniref:Biotin carboxyl carrier protein of acetyl-CoA carboxylase n=1 Tax=Rhizobium setariae TaxID=2801340 RepID=A0A936YTF1_9HYPH|nr:biotin/lipoyl-containing protein [Rhizobium setariae]MBL0372676.1 acetyl-CoA carboxylase, biotin carboxyl carrier protein [Rhizobium setariae]